MIEQVSESIFYHINSNANLSTYPKMQRGDRIEVGDSCNPFFRFYETYNRTYPVTNTDTSETHNIGAMKFLNSARQGIIRSDGLPEIAYQTANHFLMLARELFWENVRLAEFPDAPSRQKCIWLIESMEDVKRWADTLHFHPLLYSIVKVRCSGRALKVDSNNLVADSVPLPIWQEKARLYWSGRESNDPLPEIVFDGTLVVEEIIDNANLLSTS